MGSTSFPGRVSSTVFEKLNGYYLEAEQAESNTGRWAWQKISRKGNEVTILTTTYIHPPRQQIPGNINAYMQQHNTLLKLEPMNPHSKQQLLGGFIAFIKEFQLRGGG